MNVLERIQALLVKRKSENLYRSLKLSDGIDFCSNDYLSYAREIRDLKNKKKFYLNSGSTGSRLISGNSKDIEILEERIAHIHKTENAVLFSSGYLANFGLLSSIPSRHDLILFDEYCHASLIDGIHFSKAKHAMFRHNDMASLADMIAKWHVRVENIFVVTESLFSMDGDRAPLSEILKIAERHPNVFLILDEAHALGTSLEAPFGAGNRFYGNSRLFARIYTYGKALGSMGAAVACSNLLKEYLINFCRPFIYTTAPSPELVQSIGIGYDLLEQRKNLDRLMQLISLYKKEFSGKPQSSFNDGPIQTVYCAADKISVGETDAVMKKYGISCKFIRYPTVPKGKERFRITLHAHNTPEELKVLKQCISDILLRA
ncbi:MAG: aminotransferase class I/II-fold pyridoxal phosphate-dependent enzyme [Bacteroidia bacterium]|nr:aminotransferase class I/II-fold pyridoxal phosphate-dependent enzyme [Bacteroidia bacterium]